MIGRARNRTRGATLLGIVATSAVILPAFLTGAVAVQIGDDLALTDTDLGLAIGAFFAGSSGGSIVLGRLAERFGARVAIRLGLGVTIATDLAIAFAADGVRSLQALLFVAGLANALTQPAINLMLVRTVTASRLGLAMALKQSGMPGAALLGGLAVPLVALTVGWRASFVLGALLAAVAVGLCTDRLLETDLAPPMAGADRASGTEPKPDQSWAMLILMAAVGVLGGGAANILVAYLVSGAVASGIDPGPAGLLLTLGAGLGILSRLVHGWLADRPAGGAVASRNGVTSRRGKRVFEPLRRVILLFLVGAGGAGIMVADRPVTYLVATPLVFAAGWAWPGLFNLVVVKANRSAPAAATGVTQTGVYLGSVIGPIVAGVLIERWGYPSAWMLTAVGLAGSAALAAGVRAGMAVAPSGVAPQVETSPSSG